MIVLKQNTNATVGYKDFRVQCQAIQQWLTFLHAINPLCANINIDFDLLSQLPEDGSVEGEVSVIKEEELGQNADNISAAARETNVSPIQAALGPEQGGASGINNPDKDQIIEGYIASPLLTNNQTKIEQLRQIFINRFSQNSDTSLQNTTSPLDWPEQGNSLNNHYTMFIQSLAFPTLFPFACGNATDKDCLCEVDLAESNHHLLKYAIKNKQNINDDVKEISHHYFFIYLCHIQGEYTGPKSIYLQQNPTDVQLTEEDLTRILRENGQ